MREHFVYVCTYRCMYVYVCTHSTYVRTYSNNIIRMYIRMCMFVYTEHTYLRTYIYSEPLLRIVLKDPLNEGHHRNYSYLCAKDTF